MYVLQLMRLTTPSLRKTTGKKRRLSLIKLPPQRPRLAQQLLELVLLHLEFSLSSHGDGVHGPVDCALDI